MRKIAKLLLILLAFAIPWEYSLDLGEPFGNVARIAGLLLLLVAIAATFQAGRMRTPGPFQWLTLALYLWFCCTYFWTIDGLATLEKIRAYFQEMMIVWLVWELVDDPADLRNVLRATLAGSWVLAILTFAAFRSPEALATQQIRFAAYGQDPNDIARYLDLGFPFAALLFETERGWVFRLFALGFIPLGLIAVLLTASRGGSIGAFIALGASALLLSRGHPRRVVAVFFALPALFAALWFVIPAGTIERLATIADELQGGDLNQRVNIWSAGWHAFIQQPILGTGAGSFVTAARLAPADTAHNTALSIVVAGGLCALFLVSLLFALAVHSALRAHGPLRIALVTALFVLAISSLDAAVEENRTTWLLLAIVALTGRLAAEDDRGLPACFQPIPPHNSHDLPKLSHLAGM